MQSAPHLDPLPAPSGESAAERHLKVAVDFSPRTAGRKEPRRVATLEPALGCGSNRVPDTVTPTCSPPPLEYVFSAMVGMARCAVRARVVAGGMDVRATMAFEEVAPLHAALTS